MEQTILGAVAFEAVNRQRQRLNHTEIVNILGLPLFLEIFIHIYKVRIRPSPSHTLLSFPRDSHK